MHLSDLDIGVASGSALVTAVLLILAFRLRTGRMKKWSGWTLHPSSQKRAALAKFFQLLGVLSAIRTVGELLHLYVLNGIAELGAVVVIFVMLPKLHDPPQRVGVIARTKRGREREQTAAAFVMLLLIVGAVLNFKGIRA